ncbi:MAG: T9SS type A sorting domain-containing protein [Bacteroidota bacterium]
MKKLLLSVIALSSLTSAMAQCSDIFISEYDEGTYNNKALELYNPTNHAIAFNNNYRMVRYNNGTSAAAGEANPQAMISLGTHVMQPYSTWVIVIDRRDTTITSGTDVVVFAGLRALADTFLCTNYNISYTMNFNGNDAISVQKTTDGGTTWNYVDIFGMMGDAAMVTSASWSDQPPYDGSVGAWWTLNHTLIRKPTVTGGVTTNPSPEFNVTVEYDSLPVNDWSNLHIHSCVCNTGINELTGNVSLNVYPNPSNLGYSIIAAGEPIELVDVYNIFGQKVLSTQGNRANKMKVETSSLTKGVYIVKAQFPQHKTSTVKLTIQ